MNRAVPAAVATGLAVVAFLAAYGVNGFLERAVAPADGEVVAVSAPAEQADQAGAAPVAATAPVVRTKSERTYLDGILGRNIFDAQAIEEYNPSQRKTGDSEGSGTITDLKVKLLGTVVAKPAQFSSALIVEEGDDDSPTGYGIEDWVLDEAQVIAIEKKRVTLKRRSGTIEYLTMDDEERPKSSSTDSNANVSGTGEEGVQKVGDNKYVVSRELVDKYITDIEGISRMGRALLHRGPDGEFDGYRLSAIRRNTLADQLGIRNGDVVHSVNNQALNSVQGAMNAYQGLLNENSFTFDITRRGERITVEYEIQ